MTRWRPIAPLLVLVAASLGAGCATKQPEAPRPASTPAAKKEADVQDATPPGMTVGETAREMVREFIADVREERYDEAYASTSGIMKQSYSFELFLKVAGKLQMEELPCIDDEDVEAMEPTSGNVGLEGKDVVVSGFAIRYECPEGATPRTLVIFLDWAGPPAKPGGVASMFWK